MGSSDPTRRMTYRRCSTTQPQNKHWNWQHNGKVIINFQNICGRESIVSTPLRLSTFSIPDTISTRASVSNPPFRPPTKIAYPIYPQSYQRDDDNMTSNPIEFDFQVNVIRLQTTEDDFLIDKELLQENFKSHSLSPWFFKTFNDEERERIKEKWFRDMKNQKKNVFFFD